MTSPHYQGKIPWHCLTDHVDFDGSTGFKIRLGSQIGTRKEAFAHFARALASLIIEVAEDQLSLIPKPNASPDAWRDVGVQDDALFPVDFVNAISAPGYINTDDMEFLERRHWENTNSHRDAHFIFAVFTKPANPFRHLAPLIYLAQHPRVAMRNLLSTSGQDDNGPGLRSFASLTMNYFLLLNLVLALDSGASFDKGTTRASLFHSRFQYSVPFNDTRPPHTAFWYSAPPECQSPDLRAAYSLRCFRLLVALYAFMKETTLRDIAVGMDPYMSYARYTSAFDKGTLVDVICRALKSVSPAFSDLEPSLGEEPPAKLAHAPLRSNPSHQPKGKAWRQSRFVRLPTKIHRYIYSFLRRARKSVSPAFSDLEPSLGEDPPAKLAHAPLRSNPSHQPKGKARRQSHFVGLPTEIHQYIYSFLPVGLQSLVHLAATCKRLREICTPLIYIDPFPSHASTMAEEQSVEARSSALAMVLSSKPQLASHIRRLRVCVEGTSPDDIPYPPLQLCLADSITHLIELHLYVPHPCEDCEAKLEDNDSLEVTCHFRTMGALAAVTRRWPNLSSLSLYKLGAGLCHLDRASTIPNPMPAALIPHHLEKLILVDRYTSMPLVPWGAQKALMNASSQTLRHLVFRHKQPTIHGLPTFPSLERLELTTGLPMEDIRLLLQKSFSSVRFLCLDSTHESEDYPSITLDLSGIVDDLEHLSVVSWSRPSSRLILPASVVTFKKHYYYTNPSISISGSPHLAALSLAETRDLCQTVGDFLSEENSSSFQTVRSLELGASARARDLPRLGEIIATRLPQLEVLILCVEAFSHRPRREDYPMDDGLDDVQKAAAIRLFESCPGLNTISFNRIPDIWDPIGHFPARVWTRDSGDGGVRMTGRAALPWKLGEIWG